MSGAICPMCLKWSHEPQFPVCEREDCYGRKEQERMKTIMSRASHTYEDFARLGNKLWRLYDAAKKFEEGLSEYCDGPERDDLKKALAETYLETRGYPRIEVTYEVAEIKQDSRG